jgi:hypothetical protein
MVWMPLMKESWWQVVIFRRVRSVEPLGPLLIEPPIDRSLPIGSFHEETDIVSIIIQEEELRCREAAGISIHDHYTSNRRLCRSGACGDLKEDAL